MTRKDPSGKKVQGVERIPCSSASLRKVARSMKVV